MVADSRAAPSPGGIRPLDEPRLVQVEVGADDRPLKVRLEPALSTSKGSALRGSKERWREIPEILDSWRIDDEWWRKQPVSRLYYRVLLEDGTVVGLFKDLVSGEWYRQRV